MPSFIVYDLAFLVLFSIVAVILFRKNRSSWKRHGWIFLYHSKFGLRFIDWTAKKFERILKPLQYVVILSGYLLMAGILWMLSLSVWRYVTSPIPEQLQNVPPIAPLIPYFPRLFGLDSFFPPLYFTYFLVALAIVAVSHEFAHGIFARLNNIKVKTTGLAFFGPFFGAFVEPDEKKMFNSGKFPQLSILAAGTFANVVMTVLFGVILWAFFALSFAPAGVNFNSYPPAVVNVSDISMIGGAPITGDEGLLDLISDEHFNEIAVNDNLYLVPGNSLRRAIESENEQIIVFEDAPAARAELRSPILAIDGVAVTNPDALREELARHAPGETITITTLDESETRIEQDLVLANREGEAYLGVGFFGGSNEGLRGAFNSLVRQVRDPLVHYEPTWDGDFAQFIYDGLWWIVVINILVALFNMLPVSILDGGRFFFLTVWGITRSETFGKKAYAFATWFILALLVVMTVRWLAGYI